jgi:uncharacterized protein (TIGR01777 family)
MTARVLVSGGSGLIGTSLIRALDANSIHVSQLIRQSGRASVPDLARHVLWNPYAASPVADRETLEGLDAVVHLSGANGAGHRWTAAFKQEILRSRVATTEALVRLFSTLSRPPKTFVCASAIGVYGNRGEEVLDEDSPPGQGFLAATCEAWERAARGAEAVRMRTLSMRFGVVLAADGGALKKMLPLFRLGLGGRLGSGSQWMSWISLRDTVSAIRHGMDHSSLSGPVNVVAPSPVKNVDFTHLLARQVRRPAFAAAPAFALRMALGEMADEGLLASIRAIPARLTDAGFRFEDPDLDGALENILGD